MNHIYNLTQVLREYPQSDKARLAEILSEYAGANSNDAVTILNTRFGLGKWMYCGWANRRLGLNTSPLANPVSARPNARSERIRVENIESAVKCYCRWLWAQIKGHNQAVIEALINVKADTTLVCWCAPKRCHCEVISRAATWINTLPTDEKLRLLCLVAGFKVTDALTTMINGRVVECPEWRATYSVGRQFVTIVHRALDERWKWTIEMEFLVFGPKEEELSEWLLIILRRIKYGDDWFKYRLTDIPDKEAEKRKKRARKLGVLK